jgi:hypothetical protein
MRILFNLEILSQGRKKRKTHGLRKIATRLPDAILPGAMYARKLTAEMRIGEERRPVPLDWLDSFCMRNFTGSAEFDDTLPTGEGFLEAGLTVQPARLADAMSEWFTKRGRGNGQPVLISLRETE